MMTHDSPLFEPLANRLAGRIPPAAWNRLFQPRATPPVRPERKTLTLLFIDAAGPDALQALDGPLAALLPRYRGTRDRFAPAGVLVFFEHAALAVAMAMALQRTAPHIRLRMGITTASCQLAWVQLDDGQETVTLLGAEAELAERVAASASCGSILISPSTYALVRDAVHADARDCLLAEEFDPFHGPTASITPAPARGGVEASTFAGLGAF